MLPSRSVLQRPQVSPRVQRKRVFSRRSCEHALCAILHARGQRPQLRRLRPQQSRELLRRVTQRSRPRLQRRPCHLPQRVQRHELRRRARRAAVHLRQRASVAAAALPAALHADGATRPVCRHSRRGERIAAALALKPPQRAHRCVCCERSPRHARLAHCALVLRVCAASARCFAERRAATHQRCRKALPARGTRWQGATRASRKRRATRRQGPVRRRRASKARCALGKTRSHAAPSLRQPTPCRRRCTAAYAGGGQQ